MKLIVAVDRNWGIGRKGGLLFALPPDLKHFKEMTFGKTVVMGRKTLNSLPGGKPLQGRRNIVLTRNNQFKGSDNLIYVHSADELFKLIDINDSDDVYLIGGAEIYNSLLKYCDELVITKVDSDGEADTFIPNIDNLDDFAPIEESDWQQYNDLRYKYVIYKRVPPS